MLWNSLAVILIVIGFTSFSAAQQQPEFTKNLMQVPREPRQQEDSGKIIKMLDLQRDLIKKQTEAINSLAERVNSLETRVSELETKREVP